MFWIVFTLRAVCHLFRHKKNFSLPTEWIFVFLTLLTVKSNLPTQYYFIGLHISSHCGYCKAGIELNLFFGYNLEFTGMTLVRAQCMCRTQHTVTVSGESRLRRHNTKIWGSPLSGFFHIWEGPGSGLGQEIGCSEFHNISSLINSCKLIQVDAQFKT